VVLAKRGDPRPPRDSPGQSIVASVPDQPAGRVTPKPYRSDTNFCGVDAVAVDAWVDAGCVAAACVPAWLPEELQAAITKTVAIPVSAGPIVRFRVLRRISNPLARPD